MGDSVGILSHRLAGRSLDCGSVPLHFFNFFSPIHWNEAQEHAGTLPAYMKDSGAFTMYTKKGSHLGFCRWPASFAAKDS